MNSTKPASSDPEPITGQNKKSEEKDKLSPAERILKLVEELQVDLFHTPLRIAFARYFSKDHWENWPVKGENFQDWLSEACYRNEEFVPSKRAIEEAATTLSARALYDSREEKVFIRLAAHKGDIYLDLCNKTWEAVRICKDGWDIVTQPPIKFIRAPGMLALPRPVDNGKIDDLRPFLNVAEEDHWILVIGWLVAALRPDGPFPLLVFEGTHGSAKSNAAKILRALVTQVRLRIGPHLRIARTLPLQQKILGVLDSTTCQV